MLSMGGEVHLNPAVTIAMTLTLRLRPWRGLLYVVAQLAGSLAAAALVLVLTGDISPTVNQVNTNTTTGILVAIYNSTRYELGTRYEY